MSTQDQNLALQLDALKKTGCQRIFTDQLSGTQVDRPGLEEALSHLRETDTLVVWKLDRLGRSVKGLVDLVHGLETQKVHFQSLTDGIDTKTPAGRFFFHVMASLAQMERELIRERTRGGQTAGARGRPQAPDDGEQGGSRQEVVGQRDATPRSGTELGRIGAHVVPLAAGVVTNVKPRWPRLKLSFSSGNMNYDSIHDFEVAPQKLLEEEAPSPSWHRLNWLCDQLGEYLERWLGFAKMERIPIKAMIGNKLYFVVVAALTSLVITSKG